MCTPILSIAGTGLQAFGAARGEEARRSSLLFASDQDRNNAIIASQKADRAIRVGKVKRADRAREIAQIKGANRAAAAAGGTMVNDLGNSFANLERDAIITGELDSDTIAQNAAGEAAGFSFQSANFISDAGAKRAQAGAINPGLAFATTILGGAGAAFA